MRHKNYWSLRKPIDMNMTYSDSEVADPFLSGIMTISGVLLIVRFRYADRICFVSALFGSEEIL